MPQTGTTNGHAHMYERHDLRTQLFNEHDHSIPPEGSGNETGPGGHDDHKHEL